MTRRFNPSYIYLIVWELLRTWLIIVVEKFTRGETHELLLSVRILGAYVHSRHIILWKFVSLLRVLYLIQPLLDVIHFRPIVLHILVWFCSRVRIHTHTLPWYWNVLLLMKSNIGPLKNVKIGVCTIGKVCWLASWTTIHVITVFLFFSYLVVIRLFRLIFSLFVQLKLLYIQEITKLWSSLLRWS